MPLTHPRDASARRHYRTFFEEYVEGIALSFLRVRPFNLSTWYRVNLRSAIGIESAETHFCRARALEWRPLTGWR